MEGVVSGGPSVWGAALSPCTREANMRGQGERRPADVGEGNDAREEASALDTDVVGVGECGGGCGGCAVVARARGVGIEACVLATHTQPYAHRRTTHKVATVRGSVVCTRDTAM